MKLAAEKLEAQLGQALKSVYLVCGDEALLRQECEDLIRQAARDAGFTEREVLHVDKQFDWNRLREAGQALSLFGDRKLIELRLSGGPGREGGPAITEFCADGGDTLLLISSPAIDKRSRDSKWYKAIDGAGAVVDVWPVDRAQLPRWIGARCRREDCEAEPEALELLADLVEGNLLAAAQEVRRLAILAGNERITVDLVQDSVASSARYNVFQALDEALSGHAGRSLTMLSNLLAEGDEPIALLGAISRDLRQLLQLSLQRDAGRPPEQLVRQRGIWPKKQPLYLATLQRLDSRTLKTLLYRCEAIDRASRGLSPDNPRHLLAGLLSQLAGTRIVAGA